MNLQNNFGMAQNMAYQQQPLQQQPQQPSYGQQNTGIYQQQQQIQQPAQYSGMQYQNTAQTGNYTTAAAVDGVPTTVVTAPDNYQESSEDLTVPLSLSTEQLTPIEQKTYLRWYNKIASHTNSKLITLQDIFKFMWNFKLSNELKARLAAIFRTCQNILNIGQFFAVERLISKSLADNIMPVRKMIIESVGIPKPKPILSKGTHIDKYEEVEVDADPPATDMTAGKPVDIDSFTSLLLTGKTSKKRVRRIIANEALRNKKVRFSEHISFADDPPEIYDEPTATQGSVVSNDPLDLSLPMDQLLQQMAQRSESGVATGLVSSLPTNQQETEEEKAMLEGMKDSLSHFQNIQAPDNVANPNMFMNMQEQFMPGSNQMPMQPLKPTATGSGNHLFKQQQQMNQMGNGPLELLKPTATGSANYLAKQHFQPDISQQQNNMSPPNVSITTSPNTQNQTMQPLKPTATGSANYLMKQHFPAPTGISQLSSDNLMGQQQFPMQPLQSMSTGGAMQGTIPTTNNLQQTAGMGNVMQQMGNLSQPLGSMNLQQQSLTGNNNMTQGNSFQQMNSQYSSGTNTQSQLQKNTSFQPQTQQLMSTGSMLHQPTPSNLGNSQNLLNSGIQSNSAQRSFSPMGSTNLMGHNSTQIVSPNGTAQLSSPNTTAQGQLPYTSPQGSGQILSPYGSATNFQQPQLNGSALQTQALQGMQRNNMQSIPQSSQPFGLQGSSTMANSFFQSLLGSNGSPTPSASNQNMQQLPRTASNLGMQQQPQLIPQQQYNTQANPSLIQQQQSMYLPQTNQFQPQMQGQFQNNLQQQPGQQNAFDMRMLQQQVDAMQGNYQRR